MDALVIANQKVKVQEFVTAPSERDQFGLNVYVFPATCIMWEYYMPAGTIRDKAYRGCVSDLWGAFIKNNNALLNQFLEKLTIVSGYRIHVANKSTLPSSVYQLYQDYGYSDFYGDRLNDAPVLLVFYANNR